MYVIVLSILYNFHHFLIGVRDVGMPVGDDLAQPSEVVGVGLVDSADLADTHSVYHASRLYKDHGHHYSPSCITTLLRLRLAPGGQAQPISIAYQWSSPVTIIILSFNPFILY